MKKDSLLLFIIRFVQCIIIIFSISKSDAQAPVWLWAKSAGGSSYDGSTTIVGE